MPASGATTAEKAARMDELRPCITVRFPEEPIRRNSGRGLLDSFRKRLRYVQMQQLFALPLWGNINGSGAVLRHASPAGRDLLKCF